MIKSGKDREVVSVLREWFECRRHLEVTARLFGIDRLSVIAEVGPGADQALGRARGPVLGGIRH